LSSEKQKGRRRLVGLMIDRGGGWEGSSVIVAGQFDGLGRGVKGSIRRCDRRVLEYGGGGCRDREGS